jgi:hypothetical protein
VERSGRRTAATLRLLSDLLSTWRVLVGGQPELSNKAFGMTGVGGFASLRPRHLPECTGLLGRLGEECSGQSPAGRAYAAMIWTIGVASASYGSVS